MKKIKSDLCIVIDRKEIRRLAKFEKEHRGGSDDFTVTTSTNNGIGQAVKVTWFDNIKWVTKNITNYDRW